MVRSILLFCALASIASLSVAKDIFIHSQNPISDRLAIFQDDERTAYLYLTKPGTQRPERDAIAYSRVPLVPRVDWARIKETGEPPPLSQDIASPNAILKNPTEAEFSFKWSADGHAVALLRNGHPIAFAVASEKFGYSKAVAKSSPLANAWDQIRYEALFGK